MLWGMVIEDADVPEDSAVRDPAAELLVRVAAGDEAALARLYDLLGARVYGPLVDPYGARAEEELQQVFLDVWASAASFDRHRARGDAWVMAIAGRRVQGPSSEVQTPAPASRREARELGLQAEPAAAERVVAPPLHVRAPLLARLGRQDPGRQGPGRDDEATDASPSPAPVAAAPHASSAPSAPVTVSTAAAPPTEVVQAVQRRNWTRGVILGVIATVLLVGIGWGAGVLAALWQ